MVHLPAVVPPPANVRRHFLPWAAPLLPQAVAWLAREWTGAGPLNLSSWLVVVPTRQAGRRLREALAEHAATRGQAVFPPRVVTPELLVTQAVTPGTPTANRLESLLAWTEVLRAVDLAEVRAVLPHDPPARDFAWALGLGRELARLQSTLAEGGWRLGDVAARAGETCPELDRWRELGELERRHAARLAELGLLDAQAARIAAALAPAPMRDFARIAVIGAPDPLPLALRVLAAHAATLPVDVVVYAPESEADNFDSWGRPQAAAWAARELTIVAFGERVRVCADPAEQVAWITALAQATPEPETMLGIGVADPELLPLLEKGCARVGIAAFNPEGRARRHDGLYPLLAALAEFAAVPDFAAVTTLARCPDILEWLRARADGRFSAAKFLRQFDQLGANHLPPTLAAARAQAALFPEVELALAALAELRTTLTRGRFPSNAAAALMELFAGRELEAAGVLAESAEAWMAQLREIEQALARGGSVVLTATEAWQLALGAFADEVRTSERPVGAIDLLGWLELLWDDAPHLVVAGLNDGRVPSAIVGDVFLPETLRERLGLKRNAERFACDAYLLASIAAVRTSTNGRLDILLGKTTASGDPLRPSRLLLRCADAVLPERVTQLFQPVAAARPSPPWARAWKLRPRVAAAPTQLSVTAFRDWLACPFRFYLKHVLRMTRVEPEKAELNALDFGILMHEALQQLGQEPALRDCVEATQLSDFLIERFERIVRLRYGAELTLPLVVQFEAARQRLRAAAEVEARERADGWRTEHVEWKIELVIGGLVVKGKIDRIDRHADGRVRVLDYKTGDTSGKPIAAHLRSECEDDLDRPEWLRMSDAEGKSRAWTDLQLPLYRLAVAAIWGDAVACGYFNLPKAAGETAVILWDDFSRETQASAEACATGVVSAVLAAEFWPPRELTGRDAQQDEFAELFHGGAEASIAWEERS